MFLTPVPFTNRPRKHHRQNIIKVVNGDTWVIAAKVRLPSIRFNPDTVEFIPATKDNSSIEFILTENRFSKKPIWKANWEDVKMDDNIPGLIYIQVPEEVSSKLRRGTYAFSLKVTNLDTQVEETQLIGHLQVEYEPTSDIHDIPYRG